MSDSNHKVSRAAGSIGGMTLLSRLFGFIRDLVIAMKFGATPVADAFFVAFRIPNIQRRILGEGAISSAFIPVFSEYRSTRTEQEAWSMAGNLFNILLLLLVSFSLLIYFFAPWIVAVFAPGFLNDSFKYDLTVNLTQWMAPFLLFIGLAAFCTGILNTCRVFALPAGAPVLLNVSMIGCTLWLSPHMDQPVTGLVIGVVLGSLLQFLVQWPRTRQVGFRLIRTLDWRHPGALQIARLIGPAILGLAAYEINLLIDTLLASLLPEGSISYLYYANRLVQLPLGVFGVALGVALLPVLATQAAKEKWSELRQTLGFGIRLVLFITIPATVGLILLRVPIVHVLWERGAFTEATTDGTAVALLYYAIGLCAFAGSKIVITAFYSMQDTKTPMKVGVWSMILNVILNLVLMGPLQHGGLALATSLAALFNVGVLIHLLRKRLGLIGGRKILSTTLKVAVAALLMGVLVYAFNSAFFNPADGFALKLGILIASIGIGAGSFSLFTHWMKIEELGVVFNLKNRGIPVATESQD